MKKLNCIENLADEETGLCLTIKSSMNYLNRDNWGSLFSMYGVGCVYELFGL